MALRSPPDPDRAARVIDVAIVCGVNWLDTSENYPATRNEELIGTALRRISGEFLARTVAGDSPLQAASDAAALGLPDDILDQIDQLIPLGPTVATAN